MTAFIIVVIIALIGEFATIKPGKVERKESHVNITKAVDLLLIAWAFYLLWRLV